MAKPSKRFQVCKFIGEEYAVVDTVANSTLGVHPTKEAARRAAAILNNVALAAKGRSAAIRAAREKFCLKK